MTPNTKKSTVPPLLLIFSIFCQTAQAEDNMMNMDHHAMHQHMMMDERTSLNIAPPMKLQQLQNMRSHLAAVQAIVGYLANDEYDLAAETAHSKLGLSEQMKMMCEHMTDNQDFTKLSLAFHRSGDDLGEVLKTKDKKKSLEALRTTMNFCVQCHATYRQ